jgi:hypothetical protein
MLWFARLRGVRGASDLAATRLLGSAEVVRGAGLLESICWRRRHVCITVELALMASAGGEW